MSVQRAGIDLAQRPVRLCFLHDESRPSAHQRRVIRLQALIDEFNTASVILEERCVYSTLSDNRRGALRLTKRQPLADAAPRCACLGNGAWVGSPLATRRRVGSGSAPPGHTGATPARPKRGTERRRHGVWECSKRWGRGVPRRMGVDGSRTSARGVSRVANCGTAEGGTVGGCKPAVASTWRSSATTEPARMVGTVFFPLEKEWERTRSDLTPHAQEGLVRRATGVPSARAATCGNVWWESVSVQRGPGVPRSTPEGFVASTGTRRPRWWRSPSGSGARARGGDGEGWSGRASRGGGFPPS